MKTRSQLQQQIINCTYRAIFNRWIDYHLRSTRGHGLPVDYAQSELPDWIAHQVNITTRARLIGAPLNRRNHWYQRLADHKNPTEE
jgi:hypothetical protein